LQTRLRGCEKMGKTIAVELTESEIEWFLYAHHNNGDPLHLKMQDAFKKLKEPQIGDRCAFWDDDKNDYIIGVLDYIRIDFEHKYTDGVYGGNFRNCAKIKQEAIF